MGIKFQDLLDSHVRSPPLVYYQLKKTLDKSFEDPDIAFDDYSNIVQGDPGLAARLLKIVNSPFYGFPAKVETLTHAISIIGINELVDLTLATEVMSRFEKIPRELVNMDSFWKHSLACGLAARLIAEFKKAPKAERLYLAGMLHDIGSLIIYKALPEKAAEALEQAQSGTGRLSSIEKKIFGFDHAEVGGELLKSWNLPDSLVEAVAFHHDPMKSKKFAVFAAVVHIGDIMAYEIGFGGSGQPGVPEVAPGICKRLGLDETLLQDFREKTKQGFEEVYQIFL